MSILMNEKYSHLFDKTFENVKEEVIKVINENIMNVKHDVEALIVNKIGKGNTFSFNDRYDRINLSVDEDGKINENNGVLRNTIEDEYSYVCRLFYYCEKLDIVSESKIILTKYTNFIYDLLNKFFVSLKDNKIAVMTNSYGSFSINLIESVEVNILNETSYGFFLNKNKARYVKIMSIKTKGISSGSKTIKKSKIVPLRIYYDSKSSVAMSTSTCAAVLSNIIRYLKAMYFIKSKNMIKLLKATYAEEENKIIEQKKNALDKINTRKKALIGALMPIVS